MTPGPPVLPSLVVLGALMQASQNVDTMQALARAALDSALVERVRTHADDARDALRQLLAEAAGAPSDSAETGALAAADRLALAYAVAWQDSFHVRQVAGFRALRPAQRNAKVRADSLRLVGNAALGSAGIDVALRLWRESLRQYRNAGDSAGIAAALGNIGVGFYHAEEYDSAEAYLSRSRELAERMGDFRTAGNAIGALGNVSRDRGDLRRASELYTSAGPLRERAGDDRGLAADQNNLGLMAQGLGDLATARQAFETALAANRSAGRAAVVADNLVNLGNVASEEGDYTETAARYREALAVYNELGNRVGAALVLHNLGLLAMRRGDYPAGVRALSEATGIYRRIGPPVHEIAVRRDLATARSAMGDLQGARAELAGAEALAGREGAARGALLASLWLARADLELQFNRLGEAERQYSSAEQLSRTVGDEVAQAAAQQGLGLVMLMRERYATGQATLRLALQAQEAVGDRRAAATTRMLIGYAQRKHGDTAAARRTLIEAREGLRALGDVAGEAAALGAVADLDVQAGLGLTAESLYQRGLDRLGARPAPGVAWRLHAGLARALRSRGAQAEAVRELRLAIAEIELVSAGLLAEERRAAFWADKWDVYVELALVEHTRGQIHASFDASERLRARQMLDLLARGRVADANVTEAGFPSREQDLRRRIAELTRTLEAPADDERGLRGPGLADPARGAALEALARTQRAYAELLVQMRETDPAYSALVRGDVAPVAEVMSALAPDDALLEYLVGDSTTIVFVVTADSVTALDLNVTGSALSALVDFARGTLASPTEGAARRAWRAPLRRLYERLVSPVEARGLLAGKRRLIVAPHAELHYLPFSALIRSESPEQLLIERYVIEYIPSASVWLRLRDRPAPLGAGGVLALAPRTDALPGSRTEVAAIGRIYGERARVLFGESATENAFRALAPRQGIVHLATYGVLNKHNPLFSFVELGAGGEDDGRLEVHEVFGLSLEARLLVLSACQTGVAAGALADVPSGDDWVGLVQGFLYAGASNVLATLWPVADVATAQLMERFYKEMAAGQSEGEALALAQRAAAREARTAHPFYWAGFALVAGR